MAAKEEYDVLRLIEHNQLCYVSSEYVQGKNLPQWIKYHPRVEKKRFLKMIDGIAGQLSQIHRCRGNPCYRYVNPYSIIVSEEGNVNFLDIKAKSNIEQLKIMKRRTVREHFLPADEPYYQKESIALDIYGLGRTIQYLLSETDIDPPLNKREEARFQKIISKCVSRNSKKAFQNVSEIQRLIPRYKVSKKEKRKEDHTTAIVPVFLVCVVIGVTIGGGIKIISSMKSVSENQTMERGKESREEKESPEGVDKMPTSEKKSDLEDMQEERLSMELGVVYFLELKDYEKSREYFEKADGNILAENMAVIAGCLAGKGIQQYELRTALSRAEGEIEKQSGGQREEKEDYYLCVLRGYAFLTEDEDMKNVLRIGEKCRQNAGREEQAEVLGYLALAYEGLGELESAVNIYNEQMRYEKNETVREELYKKIAYLSEQLGKVWQAQEMLRKGIEEIETSLELRTNYIGILLRNPDIERKLCLQHIKEQLKEMPELAEYEEFVKLMREHGIKLEGE